MEITIDFATIKNWDEFHRVFSSVMGFPEFYGKNMDAWIDCMSYINDPDAGMSKLVVKTGENLEINVAGTEDAFRQCPELFQAFLECTAFVNQRFIDSKDSTRVKIIAI